MMKSDLINSYNVWIEVNYKSRILIKKIICSIKLVFGNKKKKFINMYDYYGNRN